MSVNPPPSTAKIISDTGDTTLEWLVFFNQVFNGDAGTEWTPTFSGLSGTVTITGRYYRISRYLVYFHIHIVPSTSVSATAGTTYCDNFPLTVSRSGFNVAVAGALGGGTGIVREGDNRIYITDLSAVSTPVTILGIVEAR